MYRKPSIVDWKGVVDSAASILLPSNSFRSSAGWIINKGRLYPFPNMVTKTPLPSNAPTLGMRTFQDQTGAYHTAFLSKTNAYYLQSDGTFLTLTDTLGNPFNPQSSQFFSVEVMLNRMFFANGAAPLSYVSGDGNFYTAGDVPGTCFFLGKLAAHLMMINCIEPVQGQLGSANYPARLRWSGSGNPFEWDFTVDPTAGATDIADVEDALTGWATIGTTGFAFRNNGITSVTPTGNGAIPFTIENFSIGSSGIGCYYPYSMAVYGPFCVFVALDDIYYFDGGAPQPIGSSSKKSIFKDINTATGAISAYLKGSMYGGIDFLSYWLSIPQSGFTSMWIYHFNSKSWMNIPLAYGADVKSFEGIMVPASY